MSDSTVLSGFFLVISWPLLLAAAMAFRAFRSVALTLAPWAALPALLVASFSPAGVSVELPWLLFGSELGLAEDTDRLFLLFTALLWWLAGMFAQSYVVNRPSRNRFFRYFLVSMAGNIGLILTQELVAFYLFFSLMSFATYGLVVHAGTTATARAGRVYIAFVVIGEAALYSAMVLAVNAADSTQFDVVSRGLAQSDSRDLIMLLAFIGFGIKVGVVGLHMWLPLAYTAAPTPAGAVLSGAMINAALLGWLRLLPLGDASLMVWGQVFMLSGLVAAFFGVAVGLAQKDPKTLLAYSSISQMGIMTAAVGIALIAPETCPAVPTVIVLYAAHHGLCKGALFLGIGVLANCSSAHRRWAWWALWMPALALAGAPLTSGMVVKILLKEQTANAPDAWASAFQAVLPWSTVATGLLVARFLLLMATPHRVERVRPRLPTGLLWPWVLLIGILMIAPWWSAALPPERWSRSNVSGSLWPLLLAAIIASGAANRSARRDRTQGPTSASRSRTTAGYSAPVIPPGDLLVPVGRALNWALAFGRYAANEQLPRIRDAYLAALQRMWLAIPWVQLAGRLEDELSRWKTAFLAVLLLALVIGIWGAKG